jgi:hypothetical protein
MISIECVERGVARYVDEELLPNISCGGAKGFGLGVAATLLVKRGGNVLREYAKAPLLQQMGLISPDGAVDLEAVYEAAKERFPATGLAIDLPLGICLRITSQDLDRIVEYIRKESHL